jgi:hypothetical protein
MPLLAPIVSRSLAMMEAIEPNPEQAKMALLNLTG